MSPQKPHKATSAAAANALVATVVASSPHGHVSQEKFRALQRLTKRTPQQLMGLIAAAKRAGIGHLPDYAKIHFEATKKAEAAGQFDTAQKGAQWAMEHYGENGQKVVETTPEKGAGAKLQIGIKVGNIHGGDGQPKLINAAVSTPQDEASE